MGGGAQSTLGLATGLAGLGDAEWSRSRGIKDGASRQMLVGGGAGQRLRARRGAAPPPALPRVGGRPAQCQSPSTSPIVVNCTVRYPALTRNSVSDLCSNR